MCNTGKKYDWNLGYDRICEEFKPIKFGLIEFLFIKIIIWTVIILFIFSACIFLCYKYKNRGFYIDNTYRDLRNIMDSHENLIDQRGHQEDEYEMDCGLLDGGNERNEDGGNGRNEDGGNSNIIGLSQIQRETPNLRPVLDRPTSENYLLKMEI